MWDAGDRTRFGQVQGKRSWGELETAHGAASWRFWGLQGPDLPMVQLSALGLLLCQVWAHEGSSNITDRESNTESGPCLLCFGRTQVRFPPSSLGGGGRYLNLLLGERGRDPGRGPQPTSSEPAGGVLRMEPSDSGRQRLIPYCVKSGVWSSWDAAVPELRHEASLWAVSRAPWKDGQSGPSHLWFGATAQQSSGLSPLSGINRDILGGPEGVSPSPSRMGEVKSHMMRLHTLQICLSLPPQPKWTLQTPR